MVEKPNEEANSQSSQLGEEALQKLVADGGNNACGSSIQCLRRAKPAQFSNCTINFNTCGLFCYFPFENLEAKILLIILINVLPKF